MTPHLNSRKHRRSNLLLAGVAVTLAMLVGCDNTEVQSVIVTGLNDLAVTLVDALFLTLSPVASAT